MKITVLIVDDSPVMRAFIKRVFGMSGLTIAQLVEAGNGEEALGVLAEEPVDLVVSDINMPVMDGVEFLRRMKKVEAFRSIPFLVVSTDARMNRVEEMITLGANGYITKPFHPERLRVEVERVLEVSNV